MYSARFKTKIFGSYDKIWQTLLHEMEHPEEYSSNIQSSQVLERFPNGLLRKIVVPDAEVRERFHYDYEQKSIESSLVGHPHIVGTIRKTLEQEPSSPDQWILESTLEWGATDEQVDHMLRRNVAHFVMESLEAVKQKAQEP